MGPGRGLFSSDPGREDSHKFSKFEKRQLMDERNINALASEVRVFLEGLDQNQVSQRLLHESASELYKELYPVINGWVEGYPEINQFLKANLFVTMCECCRCYDPVIIPSFLALFTVASHADLSNILQRKYISFSYSLEDFAVSDYQKNILTDKKAVKTIVFALAVSDLELSNRQRAVFARRFYQFQKPKEIGDALKLNAGDIRKDISGLVSRFSRKPKTRSIIERLQRGDEVPGCAYKGGLRKFKLTFTSVVEELALNQKKYKGIL